MYRKYSKNGINIFRNDTCSFQDVSDFDSIPVPSTKLERSTGSMLIFFDLLYRPSKKTQKGRLKEETEGTFFQKKILRVFLHQRFKERTFFAVGHFSKPWLSGSRFWAVSLKDQRSGPICGKAVLTTAKALTLCDW